MSLAYLTGGEKVSRGRSLGDIVGLDKRLGV